MTHSHRRKTSVNLYFRMDVPKDIRPLVGQSSWQLSLGTSDRALADVRRAAHASHYKAEIIRYRGIVQAQAKQDATCLLAGHSAGSLPTSAPWMQPLRRSCRRSP